MKATLEQSFKYLSWVAVVLILFASFTIIIQVGKIADNQAVGRKIALENNTYHRTVACILSVPLSTRTDDYISNCYLRAEQASGVQVDHFGNK